MQSRSKSLEPYRRSQMQRVGRLTDWVRPTTSQERCAWEMTCTLGGHSDGQFHYVTNLYAGDASVLPTCGSANPVMNGVALRRRLAKRLAPEGDGIGNPPARAIRPFFQPVIPAPPPNPGTVIQLFDGQTRVNRRMAGRGTFHAIDGALKSVPSLIWVCFGAPYRCHKITGWSLISSLVHSRPIAASSFVLEILSLRATITRPGLRCLSRNCPPFIGFEIQIDNTGAPDGLSKHQQGRSTL